MKKVYYVEIKNFYVSNGIDYQLADCGTTPKIFSSKKKAEKYMDMMKDWFINICNFELIDDRIFPITSYTFRDNETMGRTIYQLHEVEVK